MLEQIAKAILKVRYYDFEPDMYGNSLEGFYASLDRDHMDEALVEARAAIEALREPTSSMLRAGRLADSEDAASDNPQTIWEAMVASILAEAGT